MDGKRQVEMLLELQKLGLPDRMIKALFAYVVRREPTGGFLTAVLENDFAGAVMRADDENRRLLVQYGQAVIWALPSQCWGSRERVDAWLAGKGGV